MPSDSRITPIGRLLRFLHLDELPQLINVVRGEMCLIGPRPERPEIIERNCLHEIVPRFAERMTVLPGVTGLAQINLGADINAESVIPKVRLDIAYIESANVSLDTRILLCTAMRMIGIRHGHAVKLFGLIRSTSGKSGAQNVEATHHSGEHSTGKANGHSMLPEFAPVAFALATSDGIQETYAQSLDSTMADCDRGYTVPYLRRMPDDSSVRRRVH